MFDELFAMCSLEDAKAISKSEREMRSMLHQKSMIYGEIDFLSFVGVLKKLNVKPGGTFYDLGSGSGRAVLAVMLQTCCLMQLDV